MAASIVFLPTFDIRSVRTCNTCIHQTIDGKCKLFGKVSLLSGSVYLHPVISTRQDENLCGMSAKYWEPIHYKNDREQSSNNS